MTRLEDRAWIPEAEAWMVREKTKPLGIDLETRCEILGTAVDAWAKKEMPRVAAIIAKDLGYSERMVLEGFRRMVEAHREEHLREWVQESRGQDQGVSKVGQFDRVVGYVVAGNVPGLSVLALVEGLLSGSAVFLKLPETDQETAPSFLRILQAIDSTMASKVRANYWPGGEREIESVLFPRLDRLFVSGQEATIRELQKTYGEKVEGFGPRYSVAVLEAEPEAGLASFAQDLVRELVLWEQKGCLSPRILFTSVSKAKLLPHLESAFKHWQERWPAARLLAGDHFRLHSQRAMAQMDPPGGFLGPSNHAWTLTWGTVQEVDPRPPHRLLHVVFTPSDSSPWPWIEAQSHDLQCVGVPIEALRPHPKLRLVEVATLQNPPAKWRADGRSRLSELFQ